MKIPFLLLFSCSILTLGAQSYINEDFETGFPAGWTQVSNASDGGWDIGTAESFTSQFFLIKDNESGNIMGTNDDACNCDKRNEALITPELDFSDAALPYLFFDKYFLGQTYLGSTETAVIKYSTDGGNNWRDLQTLNGVEIWESLAIDLSVLIGQSNVLISWVYDDAGEWLSGLMLDNIVIKERNQLDPRLKEVTTQRNSISSQDVAITGIIENIGTQNINSIDVTWTNDQGSHTETLSGFNIPLWGEAPFEHPVPMMSTEGTTQYFVSISKPNGMADEDNSNNGKLVDLTGFVAAPHRNVVYEEATGTWSGWSPRGTVLVQSLANAFPDRFIPIAVHNLDPMTVNGYIEALGLDSYPSLYEERKEIFNPSTIPDFEDRFIKSIQTAARVTPQSAGSYNSGTGVFKLTSEAVALQDLSGEHRLAVILTEDGVTGSTDAYSQVNFYSGGDAGLMGGFENLPNPVPASLMVYNHVARILAGGFDGESGSLPSFMSEGSRHIWQFNAVVIPEEFDVNNINVITIVLNQAGQIVNANSQTFNEVLNNTIVGTKEILSSNFATVSPNPFTAETYIRMHLENLTKVNMTVMNAYGQVADRRNYGQRQGAIELRYNADQLSTGIYFLHLELDDQVITKKITLTN